jgi:hypothetical protein
MSGWIAATRFDSSRPALVTRPAKSAAASSSFAPGHHAQNAAIAASGERARRVKITT